MSGLSQECETFIKFINNECTTTNTSNVLECKEKQITIHKYSMFVGQYLNKKQIYYGDIFTPKEIEAINNVIEEKSGRATKYDLLRAITGMP